MIAALAAAVACTASRAIDGDTLACGGERVRLYGIDAPEMHGASHLSTFSAPPPAWVAPAARRRLAELLRGPVRCTPAGDGRDRYGRLVARCSSGAAPDLGAELVREGLAVDWPRYSDGAYAGEEAAARRGRRGLWR